MQKYRGDKKKKKKKKWCRSWNLDVMPFPLDWVIYPFKAKQNCYISCINLHFLSQNIYTLTIIIFSYKKKRLCNFCFLTNFSQIKKKLICRSVFLFNHSGLCPPHIYGEMIDIRKSDKMIKISGKVEKSNTHSVFHHHHHHHHHVVPLAQISLTLSHHSPLPSITPGSSSRLHPELVQSCGR